MGLIVPQVNVICLLSINFTLGGHVRTAYDK